MIANLQQPSKTFCGLFKAAKVEEGCFFAPMHPRPCPIQSSRPYVADVLESVGVQWIDRLMQTISDIHAANTEECWYWNCSG